MPGLRDAISAFRVMGIWKFAKKIAQQSNEDNLFTWSSAMAYSWLFAIFPFLIVLMSLIAHLPDRMRGTATAFVHQIVNYAFPGQAHTAVMTNIDSFMAQPGHGALLSIGLLLALVSSSGGIHTTLTAIDVCYDIDRHRPFWRQYLLSVALTAAVLLTVAVIIVLQAIGHMVSHSIILTVAAPLAILILVVALIYHYGPSIRRPFHIFTPGVLFCIAVWAVLLRGFKIYIDHFGRMTRYGTVGGVVILMLIFYLDSLVLLVGAEINSEIDFAVERKYAV